MEKRKLKRRAKKKGMKSACHYRVVAIALNRKGEFIGIAANKPFDGASDELRNSRHAEEQLIMANPKATHTVLISRVGKSGNFLPIDPCPDCRKLAKKYGVKIMRLEDF